MTTALTRLTARLTAACAGSKKERGDIPGWVMVVLMTAAIVAAVWAIAQPALEGMFQDAIDEVSR